MSDPVEIVAGAIGVIFGAGVAWAGLQGKIRATSIRSETAVAQAQDALARLAVERERSTKQDGKLELYLERITNLRKDVDDLLATVFRSRFESNREMPAVKPQRNDIPRQDSDPVPPLPPVRGRLGSRRGDT